MDIEAYLNQLCSALETDPLRRDELRLEVHTHLRQRADDLMRTVPSREEAEAQAVREFGEPELVAERLSQTSPYLLLTPSPRHNQRIGKLLLALSAFFLLLALLDYQRLTYPIYHVAFKPRGGSILLNMLVFTRSTLYVLAIQVLLAVAVLHRRQWARLAVFLLGVGYLSIFLLAYAWGIAMDVQRLGYLMVWIFPAGLVGGYIVWAYLFSKGSHRLTWE